MKSQAITKVVRIHLQEVMNACTTSWQSIQWLLWYFGLDQNGGPTKRLTSQSQTTTMAKNWYELC